MFPHVPRCLFPTPFAAALGAVLLGSAGDAAAVSTKESIACSSAKQRAAARILAAQQKCHGTAAKKEVGVDADCLTKAEEKLLDSFTAAEGKGGCLTTGDAAAIAALMGQTLATLLDQLPAASCNVEGCLDCVACSQAGGGPCADALGSLLAVAGGAELVNCGATPSLCSEGSAPSCGGDCGFESGNRSCVATAGYCLSSLAPCSVDADCNAIEPLIKECIHCACQ